MTHKRSQEIFWTPKFQVFETNMQIGYIHVPYLSVLIIWVLQYSLMAVLIVHFTGLGDLREAYGKVFSCI